VIEHCEEKGMTPLKSYDDLVRTLIERRKALCLSQRDVDRLSGLPDGYTSKIEMGTATRSGRALGRLSFDLLLATLRLKVLVMPASS
jgi:hypothetical protein